MAAANVLAVVTVPGDGDCLFSALALHEDGDASALRTEVADFLEERAMEQGAFAEAWLEEAEHLRGSKEDHWGGDTAITAYSLMRQKKVVVHTKAPSSNEVLVADKTHQDVFPTAGSAGSAELAAGGTSEIHLRYNGKDHYNGLVQIENTAGMVPAWPQPPPAFYFE